MFDTFKSDYASILKVSLFATIVGVLCYILLVEVLSVTISNRASNQSSSSPMKN